MSSSFSSQATSATRIRAHTTPPSRARRLTTALHPQAAAVAHYPCLFYSPLHADRACTLLLRRQCLPDTLHRPSIKPHLQLPTAATLNRARLPSALPIFLLLSALLASPIPLHLLHRRWDISNYTYLAAAFLFLVLLQICRLWPCTNHITVSHYSHLIYRPSGLLSTYSQLPLTTIRKFHVISNGSKNRFCVAADSLADPINLQPADKQACEKAADALNDALHAWRHATNTLPPPTLFDSTTGAAEVTVTAEVPLPPYPAELSNLRVSRTEDTVSVRSRPARFPFFPICTLLYMACWYVVLVLFVIFVFDDAPRPAFRDIGTEQIVAIVILAVYVMLGFLRIIPWLYSCIPSSYVFMDVGVRRDIKPGIVDAGKFRKAVLFRSPLKWMAGGRRYGIMFLSAADTVWVRMTGLTEGDALHVAREMRECFPNVFQDSAV